jgi:5-methylcytosine-specific restriction endonuclease McrA
MKTLILNLDFKPLSIVSGRRGLVLSISNKNMSVLEYYDLTYSSEYDIFDIPAVMLYRVFVKPPVRKTVSKKYILARDKMTCQYCSVKLDHLNTSVDHVVPISYFSSRDKANTWDNLVACCKRCNTKKRDRRPEDAGMELISEPRRPISFMTIQQGPEIWRKYVSTMQDTELGCKAQAARV